MDLEQIKATPLGRRITLKASDVPKHLRLDLWREVYAEKLFNFALEPLDEQPFQSDLSFVRLPGASLTSGHRSRTRTAIEGRHLANASDMVMLIIVNSGAMRAQQHGTEVVVTPGQAVMMLTSERANLQLAEASSYDGLYLPRTSLAKGASDDLGSRPLTFTSTDPKFRLLHDYLKLSQRTEYEHVPELAHATARHLTDLTSLILHSAHSRIGKLSSIKAARLANFKSYVATHFTDPALSAEALAAAFGVSADYVRKLFRESGTSYSDCVLAGRLQHASALLMSAASPNLSINQIAFDSGFSDISYFNRCFRRQFGMSPSDFRNSKP